MGWVRLDDDFYDHPKHLAAGPLGMALWCAGLAWCHRNRSNGKIPRSAALRLIDWRDLNGYVVKLTTMDGEHFSAGRDLEAIEVCGRLIEVGLWVQNPDGDFLVLNYLEYQETAEEQLLLSQKRRDAGRKGAASRWQNGKTDGKPEAESWQEGWHTDTDTDTEESKSKHLVAETQKEPQPRKHRLPADWWPSDEDWRWAESSFPSLDLKLATDHFCDHFWSNGDAKVQWRLAWRNWLRNTTGRFAPRGNGHRPDIAHQTVPAEIAHRHLHVEEF